MADDFENPKPRSAPGRTLVNAVIDGALKAGSSLVSLLSGLLAAALIMYSGYVLYDTFATQRAASSSSWDLLQFKPELVSEDSVTAYTPGLESVNRDYRAWLTVYDTSIDYPVMQGPDDLYYAYRDIYGKESLTGSIYLAADNTPDFSDSYNVIYGHHMDSGAMFGALDLFRENAYFGAHREAMLVTPSGAYDVTFFAVVSTDAYEPQIYHVGDRAGEVIDFLAGGGEGGVGLGTEVHHFDAETAAEAEKVIALSTCESGDGSYRRLVVFGRITEHIVYTTLSVHKVWDDAENQDGQRPGILTATLRDDRGPVGKVVLSEENGWTASVENIPMFRNWKPIPYTWTEEKVDGYTLTGRVTADGLTTLTNSHTTETKALTVVKDWQDDGDRDGLRPESLPVTLTADGKTIYTETLSADNDWRVTVDVLPVYADGREIAYAWEEIEVPGYTAETAVQGNTTTFTNTHEIDTISLTVKKAWEDEDNQDGIRPDRVMAILNANGTPVGKYLLSAENGWSASAEDQPLRDGGEEIVYTWTEVGVPGYELTRNESRGTETTLTNTHTPERIDLSVRKLWADRADKNKARPESLTVRLMRGWKVVGTVTLTPQNSWLGTVEDLPRYENGEEIQYWWSEPQVKDYVLRSVEKDGNLTYMTNAYDPDQAHGWIINHVGDCFD